MFFTWVSNEVNHDRHFLSSGWKSFFVYLVATWGQKLSGFKPCWDSNPEPSDLQPDAMTIKPWPPLSIKIVNNFWIVLVPQSCNSYTGFLNNLCCNWFLPQISFIFILHINWTRFILFCGNPQQRILGRTVALSLFLKNVSLQKLIIRKSELLF